MPLPPLTCSYFGNVTLTWQGAGSFSEFLPFLLKFLLKCRLFMVYPVFSWHNYKYRVWLCSMAEVEFCLSPLARPSVAKSVRSSFNGCPAPSATEALSLAKSFAVGVVAVRPSGRSFSGCVAVCSFRSSKDAIAFSEAAASGLLGEGCFCAVRRVGRRYRVSVPCLSPLFLVARPRRGFQLGTLWVQLAK